ncbi:MAG: hypothetical protein CFE32_18755, partial [Alphaproteobacteria bacterium PA3]
MHPHAVCGHVAQSVIERLHMSSDQPQVFLVGAILVHHVAPEPEVGAVQLQQQPGGDYRLV